MGWEQWPFHPRSLTDMVGPSDEADYNERFISVIASGCSERLDRSLTILEPELDQGEPVREPVPDAPDETRLKLRRIEQINPREHFAQFCSALRGLPKQEEACRQCDADIARRAMQATFDESREFDRPLRCDACRMGLVGHASVIRFHQTPVAVALSGQFLADDDDSRKRLHTLIDDLVAKHGLEDTERQDLYARAAELETRDEFIQRYVREVEQKNPVAAVALKKRDPTVAHLFLEVVQEIERIVCAQFQMHKRERESAFRHQLRQRIPSLPANGRAGIAKETELILEEVRRFCGAAYLVLFVTPRRYISYESNSNLLLPFAFAGVGERVRSGILHFNWRKAGLTVGARSGVEGDTTTSFNSGTPRSPIGLTRHEELEPALRNGIRGDGAAFFDRTALLCQMYLSDAYRAVLLWGPFSHLTPTDLEQESPFLIEVSELVMMRILSAVQLSDSENRTAAWGDVAGLLAHYSRRATTPVSAGIRIIADYLQGGGAYSKQDAQDACDSLDAASRFISQAVRSPLSSFAATAEEVYKFAPVSLDEIVDDCVALYHPVALDKGITIDVNPNVAALPPVEVDRAKIRDAIGYVLDNAIKYSHEDKEIRIYGERSGSWVRLTIEDFGQGIREQDRCLIFGRGYQGERSRKALYEEGEGMGLFHARLIVEAHKGEIWCGCRSGPRTDDSSRLEGYRVWFTFKLPLERADV